MKTITTNLSEQCFLNRLDSMCIRHKRFDRGYTDLDVFVVKRKQQWFRIGRHLASPPLSRTDGYLAEFIFGEYRVNDCGKVEVNYRFGKPFTSIIPCIIICLVALPIFICLLYDAVFNAYYQWGGLFVSLLFSFIGSFDLFAHSKKARAILEQQLYKICFPTK